MSISIKVYGLFLMNIIAKILIKLAWSKQIREINQEGFHQVFFEKRIVLKNYIHQSHDTSKKQKMKIYVGILIDLGKVFIIFCTHFKLKLSAKVRVDENFINVVKIPAKLWNMCY
jgi:hypothetical protein